MAQYWHKPTGESEIVALADISQERLEKFQEKFDTPLFFNKGL
ncbi:hypothetical protein OL548_10350 [Lysinibacillus sp. MHQ-1]|nr:hypothetical protein OL548_10350 [Lysinibacillus sp. MHQ-1]